MIDPQCEVSIIINTISDNKSNNMSFQSTLISVLMICFGTASSCDSHVPEHIRIAYNGYHDNQYDVYLTDGKWHKNITQHPATDWVSTACGDWLYFLSDRSTSKGRYQLFASHVHSGQVKKIHDLELRDSWVSLSSDCRRLVLSPKNQQLGQFLIINQEGVVEQALFTDLPYSNDPEFSLNGRALLFRGAKKPNKKDPDFIDEVYQIDLRTLKVTQLTQYPSSDESAEWYQYRSGPPKTVGQSFSYMSLREGRYAIFGANSPNIPLFSYPSQTGYHSWTSDGQWLVFEAFEQESGPYQIILKSWSDGTQSNISHPQLKFQQAPVIINTGHQP